MKYVKFKVEKRCFLREEIVHRHNTCKPVALRMPRLPPSLGAFEGRHVTYPLCPLDPPRLLQENVVP